MFQIEKRTHSLSCPCTVRFPEALFEQLSQLAQNSGVSFNFLVLQICAGTFEGEGTMKTPAKQAPASFLISILS